MTVAEALLVAAAGVAAGAVNAAAGGGTLISFPALLATGMPAVTANITSSVGLVTGYIGGAVGYRRELQGQQRRVKSLFFSSVAGGIAGAVILLVTPADAFRAVVPFLVLLSCLLLGISPMVSRWLGTRRNPATDQQSEVTPLLHGGLLLAGAYGSYFGAGLGVLLLAILGMLLNDDLQRLNGLKSVLSFLVNLVGVLIFVVSGSVAWLYAGILLVSSYTGGMFGASVARRLNPAVLRSAVVILGVCVAIALWATA